MFTMVFCKILGTPLTALNIVAFPSTRLPLSSLTQILKGAKHIADLASISIVGGHSIDDNELKFGMSVTGEVDPDRMWLNSMGAPGDILLLTKPIGVGIVCTAMKRNLVAQDSELARTAISSMMELNRIPVDIVRNAEKEEETKRNISNFRIVHAATDITVRSLRIHDDLNIGELCCACLSFCFGLFYFRVINLFNMVLQLATGIRSFWSSVGDVSRCTPLL